MNKPRVSIRALIPAAAMLVFLLVSLSSSVNQYHLLKSQILAEAPQSVRSVLMSTQRHLEEAIARRDAALIESEVFNLGVLTEVLESSLINEHGEVVESTVISSKGKAAAASNSKFDPQRLQLVLKNRQPSIEFSSEDELRVYFPVLADQPHVLFVCWSIKSQLNRVLGSLILNLVVFWCLGAVMLAWLVWLLHKAITLPLRNLEQDLVHIAAGDHEPEFRIQTSVKEIHSLSLTMRAMHARLQDSYSRLQASEHSYRRLFELAQEGVWVIDAEGFTTMVNQSMANMLECGIDDVLGKHILDFTPADYRPMAESSL